jgi:hypothetical protein
MEFDCFIFLLSFGSLGSNAWLVKSGFPGPAGGDRIQHLLSHMTIKWPQCEKQPDRWTYFKYSDTFITIMFFSSCYSLQSIFTNEFGKPITFRPRAGDAMLKTASVFMDLEPLSLCILDVSSHLNPAWEHRAPLQGVGLKPVFTAVRLGFCGSSKSQKLWRLVGQRGQNFLEWNREMALPSSSLVGLQGETISTPPSGEVPVFRLCWGLAPCGLSSGTVETQWMSDSSHQGIQVVEWDFSLSFLRRGVAMLPRTGLEFPDSGHPPTSLSQVADTTGMCHCAQLKFFFLRKSLRLVKQLRL